MKVALHTKLKDGSVREYEAAHDAMPTELKEAMRRAGVSSWNIWRSGLDLFHVIECTDYAGVLAALSQEPVNETWQERMATFLAVTHDYSTAGSEAALPLVWHLD